MLSVVSTCDSDCILSHDHDMSIWHLQWVCVNWIKLINAIIARRRSPYQQLTTSTYISTSFGESVPHHLNDDSRQWPQLFNALGLNSTLECIQIVGGTTSNFPSELIKWIAAVTKIVLLNRKKMIFNKSNRTIVSILCISTRIPMAIDRGDPQTSSVNESTQVRGWGSGGDRVSLNTNGCQYCDKINEIYTMNNTWGHEL